MNWLFAIVPLTDFDEEYGPLLVSPGSHKLHQVADTTARIWDVTRPDAAQLPPFIDPELKAGDLLLLNMYTWHKAPTGTSTKDRCGMFNKYCAVNAPPAAGYYRYSQAAYRSLSDAGKRLLPMHSERSLTTARLLIESASSQESMFLLLHDAATDRWQLPGGEAWEEEELVGWDVGARIGSLQTLVQTQLGVDLPWMSYIADVEEEKGVCRVYGYLDEDRSLDSLPEGNMRCDWFAKDRLQHILGDSDSICSAMDQWQRGDVIRGKGKACKQSKHQYD